MHGTKLPRKKNRVMVIADRRDTRKVNRKASRKATKDSRLGRAETTDITVVDVIFMMLTFVFCVRLMFLYDR